MEAINAEVNSCLDGFTSDCVVSFSDVVEAVNCLKFGKMTGILVCLLIMLNMVLMNYLYIYLCFFHPCLFTVSVDFLVSSIILFPKCKNSTGVDSNNYRAISLSSIFGKIFDRIILNRYSNITITSERQFGF